MKAKIIITFFILTFTMICISDDSRFILKVENNLNILTEKKTGEFIVLKTFNQKAAQILRIKKTKHFELIYFDAGEAGTSKMIGHEKVAIFDIKKRKFLDDTYVVKLTGLDKKMQPTFKIEDDKIIYHYPLD